MTCMTEESTVKKVKHHLYLSNDKSQVEATGPMPANLTEQEEDDLTPSEESDFEGFTADDLL